MQIVLNTLQTDRGDQPGSGCAAQARKREGDWPSWAGTPTPPAAGAVWARAGGPGGAEARRGPSVGAGGAGAPRSAPAPCSLLLALASPGARLPCSGRLLPGVPAWAAAPAPAFRRRLPHQGGSLPCPCPSPGAPGGGPLEQGHGSVWGSCVNVSPVLGGRGPTPPQTSPSQEGKGPGGCGPRQHAVLRGDNGDRRRFLGRTPGCRGLQNSVSEDRAHAEPHAVRWGRRVCGS